ncbi:MAG: hypothetical protein Q9161_001242 [Pseudevernia consocians]
MSNASSPLLSLPQELKDRIYHFAYGGFDIDVCFSLPYEENTTIRLFACKDDDIPIFRIGSHGSEKWLPVASLGTCRQMYHDANNVFYSANNFKFNRPKMIHRFLRRLDHANHGNLALRSVQLKFCVTKTNEEREWDNAFRALAEDCRNLRSIHVEIDERIWDDWIWNWNCSRRHSPSYGKRPFLQGLLELKRLPLKTLELVMTERTNNSPPRESQFVWTTAQKREWAQSMTSAILGSG